jgi:cell division protein FtsA
MNDMPRSLLGPTLNFAEPPDTKAARRLDRSGLFGVLDIGAYKITCMIARVDSDGYIRVLGSGWQKSRGIAGGDISNAAEAVQAIRTCVGQAEDMADTRLSRVTVGLTTGQPTSRVFNMQWPVGGRAVVDQDIHDLVREARTHGLVAGRQTIHAIPVRFSADATQRVSDPRGLFCDTLGARMHIIDIVITALRSLESVIARCDLEIESLVAAPMAACLSTLSQDERELGTTVVDMGGGGTGIAVFTENHLEYTGLIPKGGADITRALATTLCTTIEHAERLKALYGNVEVSQADDAEMLAAPSNGVESGQLLRIPRTAIIRNIRPVVEHILEEVRDHLATRDLPRNPVVLTGGASQLPGLGELAGRVFGRPVRLGRPPSLRGAPELTNGPGFAVAAGLLMWAAGEGRAFQDVDLEPPVPEGLLRRLWNSLRGRHA